jgi:hypothetical protein
MYEVWQYVNVKFPVPKEHVIVVYKENRCKAPHILDLRIKWRYAVSFTLQLL